MYGSHDMRHTGFRRLKVVNGTPGFWGVTKSFLTEKDVTLCISWLTITQDPVIGIGQPMSKFWDRVMAKFLETNVGIDPPRTLCSVQNRWDKIRHYYTKWRGILAQIANRPQSGANITDEVSYLLL